MATPFSENEKSIIKSRLNQAAEECLGRLGVRRTTVDQLAKMAGISKGAFYSFYPSKEVLFFSVYEEYQKSLMQDVTRRISGTGSMTKREFSELIYGIYQEVRQSFLMNLVVNQELEYLARKLPPDIINRHHSFDQMFADALFEHIKIKENTSIRVAAAALRAVFTSMLHTREIGEGEFDDALRLLIAGLAEQIMEE